LDLFSQPQCSTQNQRGWIFFRPINTDFVSFLSEIFQDKLHLNTRNTMKLFSAYVTHKLFAKDKLAGDGKPWIQLPHLDRGVDVEMCIVSKMIGRPLAVAQNDVSTLFDLERGLGH
jgi:hypothetical protein